MFIGFNDVFYYIKSQQLNRWNYYSIIVLKKSTQIKY